MRHCIYCGMPIEEDDRFCVRCGKEQPAAPAEDRPGDAEDATVTVYHGGGLSRGAADHAGPEMPAHAAASARSSAAAKAGAPTGKTEAAGGTAAGPGVRRTDPGDRTAAQSPYTDKRKSTGEKGSSLAWPCCAWSWPVSWESFCWFPAKIRPMKIRQVRQRRRLP